MTRNATAQDRFKPQGYIDAVPRHGSAAARGGLPNDFYRRRRGPSGRPAARQDSFQFQNEG
jgi:hypothetical protein